MNLRLEARARGSKYKARRLEGSKARGSKARGSKARGSKARGLKARGSRARRLETLCFWQQYSAGFSVYSREPYLRGLFCGYILYQTIFFELLDGFLALLRDVCGRHSFAELIRMLEKSLFADSMSMSLFAYGNEMNLSIFFLISVDCNASVYFALLLFNHLNFA